MAGMVGAFFNSICQQQPRIRTELSSYQTVERWCEEVPNVFQPWAVTAEAKFSFGSWRPGEVCSDHQAHSSFSIRTARKYLHYSSMKLKRRRHLTPMPPLQTVQCPLPCKVGEDSSDPATDTPDSSEKSATLITCPRWHHIWGKFSWTSQG